jgi:hypothetical protein
MNIGLVKGRHEMPVDKWVFEDGIPDDKLNDYDWLVGRCILAIGENRYANMNLYVSGFTPATVAFLRAWDSWRTMLHFREGTIDASMLLSLSLMHYNPTTKRYDEQVWFEGGGNE